MKIFTAVDTEWARRKMKKRLASILITGMAETGLEPADLALMFGMTRDEMERAVASLVNGEARALDLISDIALGMDLELRFSLTPRQLPETVAAALEPRPQGVVGPQPQQFILAEEDQ